MPFLIIPKNLNNINAQRGMIRQIITHLSNVILFKHSQSYEQLVMAWENAFDTLRHKKADVILIA